ncbi:MAG: RNA polymerase sigma factor [Candidatus Paceibacterota bacterium]|jgi:RNA polymerase sigma-70 factor (ECF subfamily)
MNDKDLDLIKDYLNGDEASFPKLVDIYLKSIFNFSYRIIGSEKDAEDITQEIFLKVWKNLKKFDIEKSFKTWIFSIAKNTCIDYLRKKRDIPMSVFDDEDGGNFIQDNLESEESSPEEKIILKENKKIFDEILKELSITQREIIVMKYVNELSLSEVAEIMNMPKDTVKSHHRRALLKMRDILNAPKSKKPTY